MCDLLIKSYNFPVVVLGNDYTLMYTNETLLSTLLFKS